MPAAAIRAGDGRYVLDTWADYGRITADSFAGKAGRPMVVQPWQRRLIERIYARDPVTGRRRHRRALIGTARKNGKTGFAAVLAIHGLTCEGSGAQVFSCAADKEQAKLIFNATAAMVRMDPELDAACNVLRNAIEFPEGGSVYRALSSEAFTKEGLGPSLVLYDELHAAPDRKLYDVMSLAMGARIDPMMVIVTTSGVRLDRFGQDSVAKQQYDLGRRIVSGEVEDPTFYMAWWEPGDPHAAFDDRRAWRESNPGLGVILDPADMLSALPPATPENEYRTKRLNQWVVSAKSWLPFGSWDSCADRDRVIDPREPVVLSFDGSWTNDSTGIGGCTVTGTPHLFTVDLWEPALTGEHMDDQQVEDRMAEAMARYNVVAIAVDPALWRQQHARWVERGWPVIEFPNTLPRMIPACREFYASVVEQKLTHDGDPRMARHVANATIKEDSRGQRIVKQARGQKIDLAICAVMGLDVARHSVPTGIRPAWLNDNDPIFVTL